MTVGDGAKVRRDSKLAEPGQKKTYAPDPKPVKKPKKEASKK